MRHDMIIDIEAGADRRQTQHGVEENREILLVDARIILFQNSRSSKAFMDGTNNSKMRTPQIRYQRVYGPVHNFVSAQTSAEQFQHWIAHR